MNEKIILTKELELRFGNQPIVVANCIAEEEAAKVIQMFQERWDSGASFTKFGIGSYFGFPEPRESDSEEERAAAAAQLNRELLQVIRTAWITNLSREDCVALCGIMDRSMTLGNSSYRIMPGLDIHVPSILAEDWNKLNPDAEPVLLVEPEYRIEMAPQFF